MSRQRRTRKNSQLSSLSDAERSQLQQLISGAETSETTQITERVSQGELVPLTPAQKILWYAWKLDGQDTAYNLGGALHFKGQLQADMVRATFDYLSQAHDALRIRFFEDDQQNVWQRDTHGCAFTFSEQCCADITLRDDALKSIVSEPFDLIEGPLLRVGLVNSGNDSSLVVTLHHIIADGTSMQQLLDEFVAKYVALSAGDPVRTPVEKVGYLAFSKWLNKQDQQRVYDKQLSVWRDLVNGDDEPLRLPANNQARQQGQYKVSTLAQTLTSQTWQKVTSLASERKITPYLIILTAWQLLLSRLANTERVNVGVPVANRHMSETLNLVGFFVNTQVIPLNVIGTDSFAQLLAQAAKTSSTAQGNQDLPFEHLLKALKPHRQTGIHPIFQVMFNYLRRDKSSLRKIGHVTLHDYEFYRFGIPFDLQLDVIEEINEGTTLNLIYANELYDEAFAQQCLTTFDVLLSSVISHIDTPIAHLPLLSTTDITQLKAWSTGSTAHLFEQPIHEIIRAQSHSHADAIAVCFEDSKLTYSELEHVTNQLARYLVTQGVKVEDRVGVLFERSLEMVISLLAVLKAGAAYVPIDPSLPSDRVNYIARSSALSMLLCDESINRLTEIETTAPINRYSEIDLSCYSIEPIVMTVHAQQLAYAIYTSGSTGNPKGVGNSHEAIFNRIAWQQSAYPLNHNDIVLQKTPFGFDVSVWEFFWPLMYGAQLVVAKPNAHKDSTQLLDIINRHQVTTLHFVPSMLQAFIGHEDVASAISIKRILCSGEALPSEVQASAIEKLPNANIYNLYGPTEAAVDVSHFTCHGDANLPVPIGEPIAGIQLYVLDNALNLSPKRVAGELYIGGIGLARGYLNRADLTSERFVANPFADDGGRLYRTGDLVCWNELGQLDYLGRTDHQVKIRGFRIELGEIEACLYSIEAVREAVVVADEGGSGQRLVAYVSGHSDVTLNSQSLQAALSESLPDYMVPSVFMILPDLPLNSNGKIDRKALPKVTLTSDVEYLTPEGEIEQALAEIWQATLNVAQVGRLDNFFALGGDSIIGLQIIAQAKQRNLYFSAATLFEVQTIAALAEQLEVIEQPKIDQVVQGNAPLFPMQYAFFSTARVNPDHYNQAILIDLPEQPDTSALQVALQAVITKHDALRVTFSQTDAGWVQTYQTVQGDEATRYFKEFTGTQTQWLGYCEQQQSSLSIEQGILQCLSLCHVEGAPSRLLWVAHHLIVDGVSWRILLADLAQAYQLAVAGQTVDLGLKTHSTRAYVEALHETDNAVDVPYWLAQLPEQSMFAYQDSAGTFAQSQEHQAHLSTDLTKALIQDVGQPYNLKINDILLSALSASLQPHCEGNTASIWLEGHGRTMADAHLDVSQTVGWFTARYPVKLAFDHDIKQLLLGQKRVIHQVPLSGVGYGALLEDRDFIAQSQSKSLPDIEFNYLGQLDNLANNLGWQLSDAAIGSFIDGRESLHVALMINAKIQNEQLTFDFVYDPNRISQRQMEEIATALITSCESIILHLQSAQTYLTVEDLPLVTMSQAELEELGLDLNQVDKIYPLSPMQKGMYFHAMQHEQSEAYINQTCLRIKNLDVEAFQSAWQAVIKQHDVLRSGFINTPSQPLQFVSRNDTPTWQVLDWRERKSDEQAIAQYADTLRCKQFDFSNAELMDLTLIQMSDTEMVFIWTCHHLITDGWSSSALFAELLKVYQGGQLALHTHQYQEYISYLSAQDGQQSLKYWETQLSVLPAPTYLHSALPYLTASAFDDGYAQQAWHPDPMQVEQWQLFAKQHSLTLNTLVQGAWSLVLSHLAQQEHVCFGATTSGRPTALSGVDTIQGMFINTMPIVASLSDAQTVAWLNDIQQQNLASREHEFISLTQIQNHAARHLEQEQWGLFDSILVFENYPMAEALAALGSGKTEFNFLAAKEETTYPVTLSVILAESVQFELSYQGRYLNKELASKVLSLLGRAMDGLVVHSTLQTIELVSADTQATLLARATQYQQAPEQTSLWHAFTEQAARNEAKTAVIFAEQSLDYASLYAQASQLGSLLIAQGITLGSRVAVKMVKSLDWVVAQLAVFKCGATLVPIDPQLPIERQQYILSDAAVDLLISEQAETVLDARVWVYSPADFAHLNGACDALSHPAQLTAYIIYTSGSTGKPKGVMVSYQALVQHLLSAKNAYRYASSDMAVMFASVGFDAAQEQLWLPLLSGATQVLLDPKETSPNTLYQVMTQYQATVLDCPPAYMQQMPTLPDSTRLCIVGGEAWLTSDYLALAEQNKQVEFVNAYGPTETVITPTAWLSHRDHAPSSNYVAIGRALAGRSLYVLDPQLNLAEDGQVGELYIGGDLLALGYVNRAGQTAERFVANPFSEQGDRLYRTGDLVRWNRDESLEYIGRIDHQVKIRGFRIELGEIEALLMAQTEVTHALVIADTEQQSPRLIAYVAGDTLSEAEMKQRLSQSLPDYMVPSQIIRLTHVPTNQNGKIDRARLPKPSAPKAAVMIAPRTDTERLVAKLWADVLSCEDVSVTDNFFSLGGDSISSLRLIGVAQAAGLQLSVKDIFAAPILADMAQQIDVESRGSLSIPRNDVRYTGLSYAQQRQWFLWKLEPQSSAYHISGSLTFSGELDQQACDAALQYIYQKHSALRSIFSESEDGTPTQSPLPTSAFTLDIRDLRHDTLTIDELKLQWKNTPFDLLNSGAFRVGLARLAEHQYELVVVMHHIVADGWSISTIVQDFMQMYEAVVLGETTPTIAPTLDYSDFAIWQKQRLAEVEESQLAYWHKVLGDEHPALRLPADLSTQQDSYTSATHTWVLDTQQVDHLSEKAQSLGVTTFGVMLAVWQVLLYRTTGQSEIRTGMPVANRHIADIQNMVGLFVNTQVIKTDFSTVASFNDVIGSVTEALHSAQLNQDLPFEKLLDSLGVSRENEQSLFQVMINHQKIQSSEVVRLPGLTVSEGELPAGNTQFDLVFNILEDVEGQISLSFEYAKERFSPARINELVSGYQQILTALVEDSQAHIANVTVLPSHTMTDILALGAPSSCDVVATPVYQLIDEVALTYRATTALTYAEQTLTYAELAERSTQFAHYLVSQGVRPEMPVGVACRRSIEMVIAVLGAWKAGASIIPLEPDLPAQRFAQICTQSEMALLISDGVLVHHTALTQIDMSQCGYTQQPTSTITPLVMAEQVAYIIYTSGSTGVPKGVAVSHAALTAHCQAMQSEYQLTTEDSSVLFASLSFDAGLEQLLVPLLSASKLTIVDAKQTTVEDFKALCDIQRITSIDLPGVYLKQLPVLPNIRLCIVGGEAWSKHDFMHAQTQFPNARFINAYGPTEAVITPTLWCGDSHTEVTSAYVPIGRAVGARSLYILDAQLNLLPAGVEGELYIGGEALARGYVGRADLTAERFIANPFVNTGERLYRTGDLARWDKTGVLEYIGRVDHQVKIRGFRIELGEIEAVLNEQPGVDSALVVVDHTEAHARLAAYVVGKDVTTASLQQAIAAQLPQYMVPQALMVLEAWPTTRNGKIDRKALPEAVFATASAYEAPQGDIEVQLASIWSQVLAQEEVGRLDNFFALGGDSIASLRFIAMAKKANLFLDVADVFKARNLQALAQLVSTQEPDVAQSLTRLEPTYNGLSYAQQRQWFLWKLAPQSDAYHICGGLMLRGELDLQAMQVALDYVVEKHSVLRTRFVEAADGEVTQFIEAHNQCDIEMLAASASKDQQHALRTQLVTQPFDLASELLYRLAIIGHSEQQHELIVVMHHIISDGWSMNLIINDFVLAYTAAKQQQHLTIESDVARYSDYAQWQKTWLENGEEARQLAYWHSVLGEEHPPLKLPADLETQVQNYHSAEQSFDLEPELQIQLNTLAKRYETTLFSMLMAAWHILLQRVSGQSEIRVGMPIANRQHADTQQMVGFFVNTQIIKTQITGAETLEQIVEQVVAALRGAQANQDLPFEKLVNSFQLERSLGDNALFQVMMNHQRQEEDQLATLPGLEISETELPETSAQFELVLNVLETPEQPVRVGLEYAKERFSPARINELVSGYQQILTALVEDSQAHIANVTVLPSHTMTDILALGAPSTCDVVATSVYQLIDEVALTYRATTALAYAEQTLTYAELAERSTQFAHYLVSQGVRPEMPVGVACRRSIEMVIAVLGAWKAGASIIPLEPDLPAQRFAQICTQSEMALLISDGALVHHTALTQIDMSQCGYTQQPTSTITPSVMAEQVAYIIYTSGSTGVPKGVAVSHAALTAHCQAMQSEYQLTTEDSSVLFASLSFDAGLEQLLVPLLSASKLTIVDAKQTTVEDFKALCDIQRITSIDLPGVYLKQLPVLPNIRLCIVGGEAWSKHDFMHAQTQFPNARFINAYGPTEAVITPTLWCGDSHTEVTSAYVPIGRAVGARSLYILDAQLNLLPAGVEGELYIGGEALARGYVGRADLTAERFIANPFVNTGERLYRTGDLARWDKAGVLEYIGRVDHQVKIRGFRIELGEIEAVLNEQPGVDSALVVVDHTEAHARLAAYVVGKDVTTTSLQQAIAAQLPQYMVPQALMVLEAWPTTRNGKIDRKALPEAVFATASAYEAPQGDIEVQLASIWSQVLAQEEVGRLDNFFALGGDSISALRVVSRIEQVLEVKCPVKVMFEAPTIVQFAQAVTQLEKGTKPGLVPVTRTTEHALSPAQLSLWLNDQLTDNPLDKQAYNISGGVSLLGDVCAVTLKQAFNATIARHETLRMQFVDRLGDASVEILPEIAFDLPVYDLSELDEQAAYQRAQAIQVDLEQHVFDLSEAPLIKACLVKLVDAHHLYVNLHHIISDGWSIGVLVQDLGLAYQSILDNEAEKWPQLPVQYVDYAAWQQAQLSGKHGESIRQYWRETLSSPPANSALPPHFPRPEQPSSEGASVDLAFTEAQTEQIKAFAKSHHVSLHTVLLSAYQLFLHAVTSKDDVIIGSDLAGRDHPDLELLIGFFIRVLPQRSQLDPDQSVTEYLQATQNHALAMVEHQAMGLEALIELSQVERIQGVQPLVQQLFVMQNTPQESWPVKGLTLEALESKGAINSKFDSALFVMEENELQCSWVFRKQLYNADIMQQWLGRWQQCVMQLIQESEKPIRELLSPMTQDIKTMQKAAQGNKFSGLKKGLKKRSVKSVPVIKTHFLPNTASFPVIIEPSAPDLDPITWAAQNRSLIEQHLNQSAGIIFRNFALTSPQDFEKFADAIQPGLYGQYGDLPKKEGGKKTYKSTPYPEKQMILYHNESAHLSKWPRKQWFFCELPSKVGGATPIVDCRRMLEVLPAEIVEKFTTKGLLYVRNFIKNLDVSWQDFYKTESKEDVEQLLNASNTEFKWLDNDGLQTRTRTHGVITHPMTGAKSFFNQVQLHHESCLDPDVRNNLLEMVGHEFLPRNVFYGDGSPISTEEMQIIGEAYEHCAVRFDWQQGDVVMLDNMLAAHARDPYEEPRKIVVAMGDMVSQTDLIKASESKEEELV